MTGKKSELPLMMIDRLLVLSYIKNNLKNTNDVAYLVLTRNSYRNATVVRTLLMTNNMHDSDTRTIIHDTQTINTIHD